MSDNVFAAAAEANDVDDIEEQEADNIVICDIRRTTGGYGFNIKGPTALGGKMQSIAGVLYPPLQYISAVEPGGAAYQGGLRKHDRVLEVNGEDVQGKSHQSIVKLVVKGGDHLVLKVIRIDEEEAARLQRLEDLSEGNISTAAKVQTNKITVKDYTDNLSPKPHTVYHVWCNGSVVAKKRYSEFEAFLKQLQNRFRWFNFPHFPAKQLNGLFKTTLSDVQKQQRCEQLNEWIKIVMACEDILKSDYTKSFVGVDFAALPPPKPEEGGIKAAKVAGPPAAQKKGKSGADVVGAAPASTGDTIKAAVKPTKKLFGTTLFDEEKPEQGTDEEVEADPEPEPEPEPEKSKKKPTKIYLPGGKKLKVELPEHVNVSDAEKLVAKELGLGSFASNVFGLFHSVDDSLVKLPSKKLVEQVSGQLELRKWLFTKKQEVNLEDDEVAVALLIRQIKSDIETGLLPVDSATQTKLAALEEDETKYIKTTRKLRTYGMVQLRPCICDYPNQNTTVRVGLQLQRLTITACNLDGSAFDDDDSVTEFQWEMISSWETTPDKKSVLIKYKTDDEDEAGEETITLQLNEQVQYFNRCVKRVHQERDWLMEFLESDASATSENFFISPPRK